MIFWRVLHHHGFWTACGLAFVLLQTIPLEAQAPRKFLDQAGIEPHIGRTIPLETPFFDHTGRETNLRETLDSKPAVLCLVYFECPMLCKLAANGLVRAVSELDASVGKDFQVIMVSFDPRDTPPQAAKTREQLIRRYARPGTDQGWHCLTGESKAVELLMSDLGFHAVWDANSQQYAHAAGVFLISPQGVMTDCLNGVEFSHRRLEAAINSARKGEVKVQSQSNQEETAAPGLICYLYDPTTGKFGAAVQWTVRVLGLGMVLGMVWGIGRLIRRQNSALSEPEEDSSEIKAGS